MAISKITNDGIGDINELTVDTDTLKVDSTNNRVGIGTSSPSVKFQVEGSGSNEFISLGNKSSSGGTARLQLWNESDTSGSAGSAGFQIINNGDDGVVNILNYKNSSMAFWTNSSERMSIDSSGNVLFNNKIEVGNTNEHGKINSQTPGTFEYFIDKGLDARGVCNGSYGGYLLLVPAYTSGTVVGKKFYGEIIADRGNTGNGNSTSWAKVLASTAYNNDKLLLKVVGSSQYFTATHKVTYSGTSYLALRFNVTGGEPANSFHAKGHVMGADSNFLFMARDSEVSNVTSFGTRILDM